MKKVIALLMALCMVLALAACGAKTEPTAAPTAAPSAAPSAAPTAGPSAAPTAEAWEAVAKTYSEPKKDSGDWADAYALIAELESKASAYDPNNAEYRFTCNCHDPANSAAGEFLYAWSDAVLAATEGKVYIDIGVSNAYVAEGTKATLTAMEQGSVDFDWTLPSYFMDELPLSSVIQNPSLSISNCTVGSYAMWDLYKESPEIQAEYDAVGKTLFVWVNCTSPICYKGDHAIADISEIQKTDNIRGNDGPVHIFIDNIATFKGSPITEVYTNVSTGVLNYLITDWHAIASFSFYDPGVLNYYVDTFCGCGAYCLMANEDVWSRIEEAGYADAIDSVSGDYLLQLVPIWNYWEALGRYDATTTDGVIYDPSETFATQLQDAYNTAATQWISETASTYNYDEATVQALYDKAAELVEQYQAEYGY